MPISFKSHRGVDVAVIGGGLIGAAIAWGAARQGARVALLDAEDGLSRASRGNFGLIWLQGKGIGNPPYLTWSQRAGRDWGTFAATLTEECGFDIGWRQPGGLHFCFSDAELQGRVAIAAETQANVDACAIEVLDRTDLQKLVPQLGNRVVGASFSKGDSHVSPLSLMHGLHVALQRRGGSYAPDHRVSRIVPHATGFALVTGSGTFECDRLVIAAGLGATDLAAQIGITLRLSAEPGQIVVTERVAPYFPYVANCLRQTEEGSFLFGSSHDATGPIGQTDVATAARLVERATAVFPSLRTVSVLRIWGSSRILSPDGLPIYQQSRAHPAAFAVTCHSGVTLASVHAMTLGPALANGRIPPELAPFSTDRFHVSSR